MKKITLLFALLITSIGFSQTYDLLESFNGTGYEDAFGGTTAAYDADPTDASTQVVKITSTDGSGEVWQGINVSLTSNYTLTSATQLTMQLDVYSTSAITIAPKAQGGMSGAPDSVTSVDHTGSGWETLTFTFDKSLDGKVPANGDYNDFALHINWDTAGNAFGAPDGRIFYIKNLKGLAAATPATYDLLESFNGTGYEDAFGGTTAAYDADPTDASTQVVKITSTDGSGEVWQGINVVLTSNYTLTAATQLSMQLDVYSTTAITIAPKAQGGVDGAPDSVTSVDHTGSGWETLTFTFDQSLDGKVPANGDYADFALHINWDTGANAYGTPDGRVFYIKNLKGLSTEPVDNSGEAPTTAAPTPPTRNAWDVISLYSDAYTDVAANFDAGWCGSNSIEEVMIDNNPTIAYKGNGCQGIVLDNGIDASAFTHLHVDIYIEAGYDVTPSVFNLKFVQQPGGAAKEVLLNIGTTPALEAGKWISVDVAVDLAGFDGFKEFGITSNMANSVWYDNLYAYRAATASVENNALLGFSMYPNPASDRLNISAKETIQRADVFNVLGKRVMSVNVNKTNASLDISNLTSGIYLVKYDVNGTAGTAKFIKQ
ncbi:T9SS type A sorting domain-containing protein [Polaribacter sp. R77954]|uniref:T9SS type A sorting domain-containing protein n=1 Tax=Polaribacter sp. R77954 TaxID=3093870 RepID=UPI0037C717FE